MHFNASLSSGFHMPELSLALPPGCEDMQIPLSVSCQDFFCAPPLVFAGGVCLYLYYIVILGRAALPYLILPCFAFCIAWYPETSMAGESLLNILPAALGRTLVPGVVFPERPLYCAGMGRELGAAGRRS